MDRLATPDSNPAPLLRVSGLRKTVPGGRVLFAGLELAVERGEFVAIMGESGAGKSTLLNLIAGLDTADTGEISILGQSVEMLSDDERTGLRRRCIGFVFQAFHLLPHLTLAQNVALPLVLRGAGGSDALQTAGRMLAEVGLQDRDRDFPRELSGGELQRVAIARALVHGPSIILADEPTGNLDPDTAERILELFSLRARHSGASVLLVTHSPIAAAIADRKYLLRKSGLISA